ncbi:MAG: Plasmid encoded restriction endonuclease Per [Phenylobacterium sp.]|nr:Plasmid encoded restriction endonuclease Per [Phenylobacterium sp.]
MARAPDKEAATSLSRILAEIVAFAGADGSEGVRRRIRKALAEHADAVERARSDADSIRLPTSVFDPADPKIVGRMVSLALVTQPMVPLSDVRPTYGSGVYAIYYRGQHPLYFAISNTETPIYVGKADPRNSDASTPREQGDRLTGRLLEHQSTIATVENYAREQGLPEGLHPLSLADFTCRRLVCATNAQLVAERHLIRLFWPIWNSDTNACWGMSKHGDAAKTRANKRSPWDVVHPGRRWALDEKLEDKLTPDEIRNRINANLIDVPPRADHKSLVEEMLASFLQEAPRQDETLVPPLAGAPGPDEEEAGADED